MKTWIVVASRTEAKIFEYANKRNSEVEFVTKLENPRGRLKAQDINADKPGVFSSIMSYGGTRLVTAQSPTERIAQEFAKKIAEFLEHARQRGSFDDVVLFADPHFLGRMRGVFSKKLRQSVSKEITKDLGSVTTNEIKSRLFSEPTASASL